MDADDEVSRQRTALAGIRVLVVDDQADSRGVITAALEGSGAEVTAVAGATEALAAVKQATPDVLVSDIAMPGTDGHALMRRLRELSPRQGGGVPALALTAYAAPEDRTRALLGGYQLYLSKPFDPDELVALVASLARRTPRT